MKNLFENHSSGKRNYRKNHRVVRLTGQGTFGIVIQTEDDCGGHAIQNISGSDSLAHLEVDALYNRQNTRRNILECYDSWKEASSLPSDWK